MPNYIIMRGNLSEGFRAIGPFADRDAVYSYPSEPGDWTLTLEEPSPQSASEESELHDDNEPPEFRALDDVTRCDLTEWFNRCEPDAEEFALLAKLANDGRFKAWDCPSCMDRVYEGKPESWDSFQGVRQNDRVSYPGNGPNDKRCDSCRCHNR